MSQYGPQGTPVTVPATEPTIPASAASSAATDGSLSPFEGKPDHEVVLTADGEQTGAEYNAEQARRAEQDAATLRRVNALLPEWENRAARTLIKSDYQRGQRDNLLACLAEVRKALGVEG